MVAGQYHLFLMQGGMKEGTEGGREGGKRVKGRNREKKKTKSFPCNSVGTMALVTMLNIYSNAYLLQFLHVYYKQV